MYGARIFKPADPRTCVIATVLLAVANMALGLDKSTLFNVSGVCYYMVYIAAGYLFCRNRTERGMELLLSGKTFVRLSQ